jgi:hypothetical protein
MKTPKLPKHLQAFQDKVATRDGWPKHKNCYLCNKDDNVKQQWHHVYPTPGYGLAEEKLNIFISLCKPCHFLLHKMYVWTEIEEKLKPKNRDPFTINVSDEKEKDRIIDFLNHAVALIEDIHIHHKQWNSRQYEIKIVRQYCKDWNTEYSRELLGRCNLIEQHIKEKVKPHAN